MCRDGVLGRVCRELGRDRMLGGIGWGLSRDALLCGVAWWLSRDGVLCEIDWNELGGGVGGIGWELCREGGESGGCRLVGGSHGKSHARGRWEEGCGGLACIWF